jgi:DNA polymerase
MAARVMLGSGFRLLQDRGKWVAINERQWCLPTVHPSFVLRSRVAGDFDQAFRAFVDDLRLLQQLPQ